MLTIYPPEFRAWTGDAAAGRSGSISSAASVSPKPRRGEGGSFAITNPPPGAIYSVDPTLRREFQALPLRVVTERPITERLRFSARAWLDHTHGPIEADFTLRDDIELPAGYNPRTLAWAAELQRRTDLTGAGPQRLADQPAFLPAA